MEKAVEKEEALEAVAVEAVAVAVVAAVVQERRKSGSLKLSSED